MRKYRHIHTHIHTQKRINSHETHTLTWQINLVEHWDHFQVVFKGQPDIGQGLCFHTLAGIYHLQGTRGAASKMK